MTGKRSRLITITGTGTLVVAAAASVAVAALPAGSAVPKTSTAYAHLPAVSHQQDTRLAARGLANPDRVRARAMVHKLAAAHAAHEVHLRQLAAQAAAAAAARQQPKAAQPTATQQAKPTTAQQQAAQPRATAPQAAAPSAPSGSPRQIAEAMLSQFGWSSSQFSCLDPLWAQESGWSVTAQNAGSGAYGIPQALPGSKMASAGANWQTNAATQIRWGLRYIQSTYGSPCAAWSHEQADGWY